MCDCLFVFAWCFTEYCVQYRIAINMQIIIELQQKHQRVCFIIQPFGFRLFVGQMRCPELDKP